MSARAGTVSDADQMIADQMAAVAEPWPDATVIDTGTGGTAGVAGESLEQALGAIRPHGPQHVWRPTRPYMLPRVSPRAGPAVNQPWPAAAHGSGLGDQDGLRGVTV
jgi:hypothetical protein